MRKLGLTLALAAVTSACKTAPEPVPAEASAPSTATATEAAPSGTLAAAPASANAPPSASAPPTESTARVYGETTKSVSAKVGERFSVALPSNLTLPFKWRLDPPDAKIAALLEEKQHDEPPAGCGDCVGTGGARLYTFEAKGAGTASLHFALKPLGNPAGPSQKEVTIALTVSP